jgi:hypothetical protein
VLCDQLLRQFVVVVGELVGQGGLSRPDGRWSGC